MLEAWLDYQRATLAWKCEGLDDEQLRLRAVPPSGLTLMGLVRHMAEVERWWFRMVLDGEPTGWLWYTPEWPDADFDDVDEANGAQMLGIWREECDLARAAVAGHDSPDALDDVGTVPEGRRAGRTVSLRWILVHMIEEYARHNGHADLLRERIDGTVGD
ncbi:MAG: DinB family protein [Actinomycetes bacterium]